MLQGVLKGGMQVEFKIAMVNLNKDRSLSQYCGVRTKSNSKRVLMKAQPSWGKFGVEQSLVYWKQKMLKLKLEGLLYYTITNGKIKENSLFTLLGLNV